MRIFCSLIFLSLFLYSENINEQIHALQNATPQERVELMNSIKEQLISMNEEKRIQTLETLRDKLQHNSEAKHEEHEVKNEMTNHRESVKEHHALHEDMCEHEDASHIHQNELHQHREHHEEHFENNSPRGETQTPRSEPRDNNRNGRTK